MIADERPRFKIRPQERRGDRGVAHAANDREPALSIGIGVSTLLRWQKDPEFDAEYRAAQRAAYRQTTARLQQASPAAATVLTKLMVDSNTPASVRARTADSVLSHAAKAIEIQDLEARVAELERSTEASKPGHTR